MLLQNKEKSYFTKSKLQLVHTGFSFCDAVLTYKHIDGDKMAATVYYLNPLRGLTEFTNLHFYTTVYR